MLKRFFLALALFAGLLSPSHAAGTMAFSLSQQFDSLGNPLNGGKLYFFQAGTTTPQNAYSDSGLTLALPNPITLDTAGRVPQFFLADGTIKVRLTNSAGVTQVSADGIMVIGASSGSGSGSVVDATTVLAVGDLKVRYGTGALTGFVRANGRTIGSATSGASERANSDCQELFEYLWGEDANLSVSTGRGASAAADWAANKTITLPDWRGRALAALDDMGNTAAGRLTSSYFGATATTLGAAGGAESNTLTTAGLPAASLAISGTVSASIVINGGISDIPHSTGFTLAGAQGGGTFSALGTGSALTLGGNLTGSTTSSSLSGSTAAMGSGGAHANVQPTMLATVYLKL